MHMCAIVDARHFQTEFLLKKFTTLTVVKQPVRCKCKESKAIGFDCTYRAAKSQMLHPVVVLVDTKLVGEAGHHELVVHVSVSDGIVVAMIATSRSESEWRKLLRLLFYALVDFEFVGKQHRNSYGLSPIDQLDLLDLFFKIAGCLNLHLLAIYQKHLYKVLF